MEEVTFSKDYSTIFADAAKIGNIQRMTEIFQEMTTELGMSNAAVNQAGAAIGKACAERKNLLGKQGKKV